MKMLRAIKHCDITDEPADALIYSTNVMLNCSGGVGSSLMAKYGKQFQSDMHDLLKVDGRKFANRGDVFQHVSDGMPYRAVFHTVPCDGWYETTSETIESILRCCLSDCLHLEVKRLVVSALATGYGHLGFEEFFRVAGRVMNDSAFSGIPSIVICIGDESRFHDAVRCAREESLDLTAIDSAKVATSDF